jgi:hypothetical protein
MADKIEVYGRVDGNVQFQYGPKIFSADWGGAFMAMEIANMLTRLPRVPIGKRTPRVVLRAGASAQKANLLLWLERLEESLIMLELNSLMINATRVHHLWIDTILPSELITFGKDTSPSLLVAEALVSMRLNKWGIVQQLTLALAGFEDVATRGKRSASVFITL